MAGSTLRLFIPVSPHMGNALCYDAMTATLSLGDRNFSTPL